MNGEGGDARSLGDAVRAVMRCLAEVSDTPRLDAELLVAEAAGCSRATVIAFAERPLDAAAAAELADAVERRAAGEPLAYLLGEKEFYSLLLRVSRDVLVPRPETEHLVDEALARIDEALARTGEAIARTAAVEHGRAVAVADLGTGSGALALAIAQSRPQVRVVGVDASEAALAVAQRNAETLGLEVEWRLSHWYDALAGERFDVIVCNPPYLRSDDAHFDTGIRFEPRAALDGGADGLDAIREVIAGAPAHLRAGGALILEHGYDQQGSVAVLSAASGLTVETLGRDLEGRARYVVLRHGA